MVEIRDFSGMSDPIYENMGIELSKFHKEFLEFVDQPKVTTNPTTKLLNYYYQNHDYDYPSNIYEMMEQMPQGYKKGDPEYKFIEMMENEKAGWKRKSQNCIRYLKLFTGKPQDTAGGGSRIDFLKFLIEKMGVVQTIEMYDSNMRNYGDKYTLAYAIEQGIIHEEEVDLETLRTLHNNASIDFVSERVLNDQEEDTESEDAKEEDNSEYFPLRNNEKEAQEDVFIQIGSNKAVAENEADAFKKLGRKINQDETLSDVTIDTDKNLTIEFTDDTTIVSYGDITGIDPRLSKALKSISKQIEKRNLKNSSSSDENDFYDSDFI